MDSSSGCADRTSAVRGDDGSGRRWSKSVGGGGKWRRMAIMRVRAVSRNGKVYEVAAGISSHAFIHL